MAEFRVVGVSRGEELLEQFASPLPRVTSAREAAADHAASASAMPRDSPSPSHSRGRERRRKRRDESDDESDSSQPDSARPKGKAGARAAHDGERPHDGVFLDERVFFAPADAEADADADAAALLAHVLKARAARLRQLASSVLA